MAERANRGIRTLVAIEQERIIGTISVLMEPKFSGGGRICCHIEDVAVHPEHQDGGVGTVLVERAIELAKSAGCYKVILACKPYLEQFYSKFGFTSSDVGMRLNIS
jgi:glucosamine-phosphate N-acetyltransferase